MKGFDRFLDALKLSKVRALPGVTPLSDYLLGMTGVAQVHIFGSSLGGYLALCYAQYRPNRIASLVLSNAFVDTAYFHQQAPCASMLSWMPLFMLQRIVLSALPTTQQEAEIADSIDFMVEQLETLTQEELASRLTLNCGNNYIRPQSLKLDNSLVTIMDTLDECAVPSRLREEVLKFFPDAKLAFLKTGGNFPFLARADEVNMYLQVHLRSHGVGQPEAPPAPPQEHEESDAKESTQPNRTTG